jgi:hypothetical protein
MKLYESLKNNVHVKTLQHSQKDSKMINREHLQHKKQANSL